MQPTGRPRPRSTAHLLFGAFTLLACSDDPAPPPATASGGTQGTAPSGGSVTGSDGASGGSTPSGAPGAQAGSDAVSDPAGATSGVTTGDDTPSGGGTGSGNSATGSTGSAGGTGTSENGSAGANSPQTNTVDTETGSFVSEEEDILVVEGTLPTDSEDRPVNLGSETACDGLDENNNGVIDDVDVGKDGLCDCINMGFFGQISSDAGSDTTAFEAWLVERSGEVPVKHLDAEDELTADWLASLQVLIVGGLEDRGRGFSDDEIAAFDAWLGERGAGVFTLNGYTAEAEDGEWVNELLVNTGLAYDFGGIPDEGIIGDGEAPPVWLEGIVTPDHPSVEGVTQIGVFFGYPVVGDGDVILRAEGFDLAMAKTIGNGRAFVFSDEWITQDVTWAGTVNGQANPCQQPCNEQDNICRIAGEQCERCANEPCSDPAELDAATCTKGCQPSCENESARCDMYTEQCAACSLEADARAEATPRLWLNTIRWLTPENECKVDIPPIVRVR